MSTGRVMRPDALSRIHVPTSRTRMATERLDGLMQNAYQEDSCRALFVLGEPGTGKTHLLKTWLREQVEKNASFKAVISEVPPDCTLLGMAAQILEDCGDPAPDHGTIRARTTRVRDAAERLDVIVIDEVQRLVQGKTAGITKSVATWIANLLNRKLCPLILAGEPSAELVVENNEYLERRTLGPVSMQPWDWRDKDERMEFRAFLYTMDCNTGLERSDLGSLEVALRIHSFGGGRPGQTVRLLEEALTIARQDSRPKLTVDILATAADRLRVGHARNQRNPFRCDMPAVGGTRPEVNDIEVPDPFTRKIGGARR